MFFKRSVQRYGRTPEPETPYQRAGQVWDERLGSARVQARNWRMIAFGGFGLTTAMAAGLLWQSSQSRILPYVVEVDRLGEAKAIAAADRDFQPTDPQIAWHLAKFIEAVRTVSLDPVVMRRNWLSAYDFATQRGAVFLNGYVRQANLFGSIGERAVTVDVTSVVRASDKSFQVKWIETAYERGAFAGTTHWTAILTTVSKPPRTLDVLRKNPLGIYVDGIDWSRELEPAAPAPSATQSPSPVTPPASLSIPSGSPLDPNLATSTPAMEFRP